MRRRRRRRVLYYNRAFLVPTSGSFRWGWRVAGSFLDDDTKSKLVLCNEVDGDLGHLLATHVDPEVLGPTHMVG